MGFELTDEQKLAFGIELVAALHANTNNGDMEYGIARALWQTEVSHDDDYDQWETFDEDKKEWRRKMAQIEKDRLYKQANFLAEAALRYIESNFNQSLPIKQDIKTTA